MDDDGDGLISADKINILEIDSKILNIIQEILIEMEENNNELNFGEFLGKIEEFALEVKIHDVSLFLTLLICFVFFGEGNFKMSLKIRII
jgi:hypothetical protein